MAHIEKKYSDIESIDNKKIVFSDHSTFYWENLSEHERDISAKIPYFCFRSPLVQLYIYFDDTDIHSKKKQRRMFHEFRAELNKLGIYTLDLS